MKLIIIERTRWQTFQRLSNKFADDLNVSVIMDRRKREARQRSTPHAPERRSAERRRLTKSWSDRDYVVINVVFDP